MIPRVGRKLLGNAKYPSIHEHEYEYDFTKQSSMYMCK